MHLHFEVVCVFNFIVRTYVEYKIVQVEIDFSNILKSFSYKLDSNYNHAIKDSYFTRG